MKEQLEEIEQKLKDVYAEFKKVYPGLSRLTFEINESVHGEKLKINGFYHVYDNCKSYNNINEIYALWYKHQILFQKHTSLRLRLL